MKKRNNFIFQWDKGNEQKNWISHQVSRKEQEEVFYDTKSKRFNDPKHSTPFEKRFLLFGKTKQGKKLVIAFTMREEKIRPISARPMKRKEVPMYEKTISVA